MPSSDSYQQQARGEGFTPNNVWASTPAESATEELTLPSGQTCLARRMSVPAMIETGMLGQVDVLTGTVDKYTRNVKGGNGVADGPQIDESILKDTAALSAMIGMADRMLPHVVVSPPVTLHFKEIKVGKTTVTKALTGDERKDMLAARPGLVFTDQVAIEDKMHLFEWSVGGLSAFSSFRRESDGDVGDLAPRVRPSGKAKRRSRGK